MLRRCRTQKLCFFTASSHCGIMHSPWRRGWWASMVGLMVIGMLGAASISTLVR
jgi:hypothetical protein